MKFKILSKDGKARVGELETAHGIVQTPEFNPVGTQATVKALSSRDLKEIGIQMVLANTYHLMLRPGVEVIKKMGGLHKFMSWDRPIMTDSGGFQVFSLGGALEEGSSKVVNNKKQTREMPRPRLNKISDEGVIFQSHLDGSKQKLSPEIAMKLQYELGADLIVSFDDHEYKDDFEHLKKSVELTERWALRSIKEYQKRIGAKSSTLRSETSSLRLEELFHPPGGTVATPLLYGVIHGGTSKALRIRSAKFTDVHFEAIAIGGIYGTKKQMYQMIDWVLPEVSDEKPRHLLGIGEVEDLFNGVERGIDLFDCVGPTRRARNGSLYICPKCGGRPKNNFTLSINLSKFTADKNPIDPHCLCYTCLNFSKSYLRALYLSKEILYHNLATYHNIYFIENLMKQIREAIKEENFKWFKKEYMGIN